MELEALRSMSQELFHVCNKDEPHSLHIQAEILVFKDLAIFTHKPVELVVGYRFDEISQSLRVFAHLKWM